MVYYELFSHCIKQRYCASLCSSATVVITVINVLTIIIPFFLAYRAQGLWLKSNVYREQPDVHFKYEYLFLIETTEIESPLMCTTFANLEPHVQKFNKCTIIKVLEEDLNKDSRRDVLHFEIEAFVPSSDIYSVTLLLIFDYRLHSHSRFAMESLVYFESRSPVEGRRLDAVGDLKLVQKSPLRSGGREETYNTPIVDPQSHFDLPTILRDYAARNVSSRLERVYSHWSRGLGEGEGFSLSLTVHYPEDEVVYRPGLWETLKVAWVQYLAILVPTALISNSLKNFILANYIVHSVQVTPWRNLKAF